MTTFNNALLNATNVLRAIHRVSPLVLNTTLAATAQKWACGLADNYTLVHNVNRGTNVGENLYAASNSAPYNMTDANCASKLY